MAEWQFRLDFSKEWEEHTSTLEFTQVVLVKLKALLPEVAARYPEQAKELEQDIIPLFEELVAEENTDSQVFNCVWDQLYDWADTRLDDIPFGGKALCWVRTVI